MYGRSSTDQFESFLNAITADAPYYLECERGHASLPPRRFCPDCSNGELTARPLPSQDGVETYTRIEAAPPELEDTAPYGVAVADFGPIRLTGRVVDDDTDSIDIGAEVTLARTSSGSADVDCVGFRLVE